MERAVDVVDESVRGIFDVDILTAIRWVREIWKELPSSLIKNCWDHTGTIICEEVASRRVVIDNRVNTSEENELEIQIMSLVSTRARMSVCELVLPDS